VPAVAVIQEELALFVIIRCKRHVDCFFNTIKKFWNSNFRTFNFINKARVNIVKIIECLIQKYNFNIR